MNKKLQVLIGVLALAWALLPATGQAAKGFYVEGGLGVAVPTMSGDFVDDAEPTSGISLEMLDIGYGFTKNFSIGTYWGGVAGDISSDFGDNAMWSEGFIGINARYMFDNDKTYVPYIELGVGTYLFEATSEDYTDETGDFLLMSHSLAPGVKIGVGSNFYFGRNGGWFIAPEIAWHWVQYSGEADVEFEEFDDDFTTDFDTNGSFFTALIKVGYHWKVK